MNLNRIVVAVVLAATASTTFARTLPHADLVSNYLQSNQYKEALAGCKTRPMAAPAVNCHDLECWAANAANDLQKAPDAVVKFVLSGSALELSLSRCKALSMDQRFKSAECAAAGRADTFISLRLPRMANTLAPVKFN